MRKAMKKIAAVMIALVAVIAIAGTSIPAEAAAKKPTKITLTATTKTIDVKGKTTVSVKSVKPANASKSVSFQSSNKKVATVSSKGVVTGKKAGKVTITVTSKANKKVKSSIKITVKNLKPSKISVSGLSMNTGEKKSLKVTVKPAGVYCPVTYKSNNTKVAKVNSKGEVTALKTGTAKITVTSKEKNSKGKKISATCTVKVTTKVSSLTFADKSKTLKTIGDTYTNKLTVLPANADNKKVTYKSSNEDVATVDASGKVTTKAYGETTITATAADGSKKTASYKLTVADRAKDDIAWQYMTCDEVFASIDNEENLIIIDLRKDSMPQDEATAGIKDAGYAEGGHIEGSLQVPVWPTNTKELEDTLRSSYVMEQIEDNDSPLVFICQSGASGATRAISVLKDEGIDPSRMYILKGGGKELVKNYSDKLVKGSEVFTGDYVISASDLKAKLDANETITLVDTRGIKSTAETAKNAITMSWPEISNMTGAGKAGHARPLDNDSISKKLGEIGLGVEDQIVLFSDGYVSGGWGDDGRIAWQLIQAGYKNVKMVNGGLTAMKAAGIETQKGPSARQAKTVSVTVDTTTHDFTTEALLERVKAGTVKVVDVRANAEYDGAILYGETSGGHIKGAIHIRFTDLFKYDGSLKSVAELTKMFEEAGLSKDDTIATYCTGGIRSAYMQLVLQMCGFEDSHNYAESAYRWSNTADAGTAEYWDLATAVKSLKFSKDELTLNAAGLSGKVKLTVKPANATNKEVEYSSDNEEVATVAADGTVTATGYGEATITATAVNYPDVTASYKVIVKAVDEKVETNTVFVSPVWVKNVIDGQKADEGYSTENVFVSEVSWGELSSAKNYKKAHVPGAYHINSDSVEYDDCDPWPMGDGYDDFALYGELEIEPEDNFNIRGADQLAEFLKRNNITKDTKVILYGKSASDSSVTRVAFAMLYAGVEDVKVIDGGMQGWNNANLPTETTINEQQAGGEEYDFGAVIPVNEDYIMDIDTVKDKLENDPNFRLVSIRSEEEFVGETSGYGYIADDHAGEPLGAVWGHDTDDGSYVTEDGKVASIENLEAVLKESGSSLDNELSFYCGTGWRATIPFLIAYQAGVEDISLYDGGWWLWQLKYYGWEEKGIEAQPDEYPIQQVTPEEAVNYVQLSFAEETITTDESGKALTTGATAKVNDLTVKKAARVEATVAYSSSDEKVATVAEDGTVTATGIGTATITAKAGSYEASYTVTVGEEEETTNYISTDDLYEDICGDKTYKILDVRCYDNNERGSYVDGHIVGAVSADVDGAVSGQDNAAAEANVKAAIAGDSDSTKYALVCYSGKSYAAAATKILKAAGVKNSNIYTVKDGMIGTNGWTKTEKYNNYVVKSYTSSGGFEFQNGVTVDQLKADLEAEKSVYTVFDLRDAVTYAAGHIDGAVSTPLREDYNGNTLAEADGKANLQKGIDANPNAFYVLECYSGNKFADLGLGYLKALGIKEERIIVLEGGAQAWSSAGNAVVKSTVPVVVDEDAKSVTVYGVLNGTYLEEPTKHYMSTTGCSLGNQCLFEGLCDRLDFADALAELGATPWNTDSTRKLTSGEYITSENGDNSDYTHVDVTVTWSGNATPVSMADTLKTIDGSELSVDQVFSNSKEVSSSYKSGCLLCTCSCYAGVVTNEDMPFVSGADVKTMGNADVLPDAGTVVKVTVTLK